MVLLCCIGGAALLPSSSRVVVSVTAGRHRLLLQYCVVDESSKSSHFLLSDIIVFWLYRTMSRFYCCLPYSNREALSRNTKVFFTAAAGAVHEHPEYFHFLVVLVVVHVSCFSVHVEEETVS